jgi:acetolactate synthase-1/2/3 large subunit
MHTTIDGQERALLVSGVAGDAGGGLFRLDGDAAVQLDRLSSTGLAVADGTLQRLLWSGGSAGPGASELLVYDATGVLSYRRLDGVIDPHDLAWHDGRLVVASAAQNALFDISGDEPVPVWRGPDTGDSWHVNCLLSHEGRLLVSAFGRFDEPRGWAHGRASGAGIVFDATSGATVVNGLSSPHQLRAVDGLWVICNSGAGELLAIDPHDRSIVRRAALGGWTRGLAITDDALYVGVSAHRYGPSGIAHARIVVLDRDSWEPLATVPLPCTEVYDVVALPAELLDGVRRGFETNTLRSAEQDQHALFRAAGIRPQRLWPSGEPLAPESCRVTVEADLPPRAAAGGTFVVPCRVTNRGGAVLTSWPPHPVHLAYRWFDGGTQIGEDGARVRLPHSLAPGEAAGFDLDVIAPATTGSLELRVTLVQELVTWFDDIDPANAAHGLVDCYR